MHAMNVQGIWKQRVVWEYSYAEVFLNLYKSAEFMQRFLSKYENMFQDKVMIKCFN